VLEISLVLAPSNKKEGSRIYKFAPRKERRVKPATQQRRVARQSKSPPRSPPSRRLPLPRRARQLPLRIFLTRKNPPISLLPRRVRLPQRKPATTKKGVGKGNAPKKLLQPRTPLTPVSNQVGVYSVVAVVPQLTTLLLLLTATATASSLTLDSALYPPPPATSSELRLRNSRQQYSPTRASIHVAVPVVDKPLTSYIV
jgi:hypothetical protein